MPPARRYPHRTPTPPPATISPPHPIIQRIKISRLSLTLRSFIGQKREKFAILFDFGAALWQIAAAKDSEYGLFPRYQFSNAHVC